MLKLLTYISRVLVGLVFVYSGFVKLVDPIGSMYKFQEYFSEDVLNLEFLIPYALPFSIFLILSELLLGIMLLIGFKSKLTTWSIFGLTFVFLFLTWYSYTYNKVTDCGCFGDALKISPKDTFYKNVILIVLIIILIVGVKYIKPIISNKFVWLTTIFSLIISGGVVLYVLNHLPIIDFRPYSVGTNIAEGMKYKGDGEVPPIHDFAIDTDNGDKLDEMLGKEKAMLIILRNFDKIESDGILPVSKVAKQAKEKGYEVYVLTSSYVEDMKKTQEEYELPFVFGFCDETALKTVIRANPGIVTVEKGIVTGKWNWTDTNKIKLK